MSVVAARRRVLPLAPVGRVLETVAALVATTVSAVIASAHLLRGDVVEGDAMVHQYWMRRFADPALFTDALTAKLRGSERYPDGYQALFWLASHVADPIVFGEWLGVALMAAAGWLVFAIVREHTDWQPAAWIGGALFLGLQGHRFFGGFPRGFLHVVVLLTVLLALRRRERAAALVAAGGALFYPPAAFLAVGVLCVSALRWRDGRPGLDAQRARTAALAAGLGIGAIFVPQLLASGSFDVMSAAEARRYPEFGEHGDLHFFAASALDYLRQNRSGLDLRATGSLLLLAALALLLVRRSNLRRVRPEVLAMPVASLAAYGLAQALLFTLYLPHRYTYPLLAFCAIAVAVTLRPTWEALAPRPLSRVLLPAAPLPLAFLALSVFPLGPLRPPSAAAWWVWPLLAAPALAAPFIRDARTGALAAGSRSRSRWWRCPAACRRARAARARPRSATSPRCPRTPWWPATRPTSSASRCRRAAPW